MSTRRGWIGLAILALAVIVAITLWRGMRSRAAETEEAVTTEVSVHVGTLARATLHRFVVAFGMVEPDPAHDGRPAASARLAAPVSGIVATVSCSEGQRVAQGTPLIRLDTRIADAQVSRARASVTLAELNLKRQNKMQSAEATSQRALQETEQQLAAASSELAAAQTELELLVIKAPLAGTIVRLAARPGDAVDTSTVLVELVEMGRLVVTAGVPSSQAASLKEGQRVELSSRHQAPGAPPLTGTLAFVGVQTDVRTDTVPIRVAMPSGSGLNPGQVLDLRIVCEERTCLAVPEDAVVRTGEGGDAIAVVEGDTALVRPVKAGLRDAGLVEVEGDGLKEGMTIVTEGAYGLPSQTKIKVIGQ